MGATQSSDIKAFTFISRTCNFLCCAYPPFDTCPTADDGGEESSTVLVRGFEAAKYHDRAAEPTMQQLRRAGVSASVIGGGRIDHDSVNRLIVVYGCDFAICSPLASLRARMHDDKSLVMSPDERCWMLNSVV